MRRIKRFLHALLARLAAWLAEPSPALPPPLAAVSLRLTNAGKAAIAHWLALHPWRGTSDELEARHELHAALGCADIKPSRNHDGVLVGLHFPVDDNLPPDISKMHPDMAIRALRAHNLSQQRAQAEWLQQDAGYLMSARALRLALTALEGHAIPANLGPAAVETMRELRRALGN